MTEAQEHLQKLKKTLGQFGNPAPRKVDTVESMNAYISEVQSALDAIRPKGAMDEDPPHRKRKKKDPNRMHTGGLDREG